MEGKVLLAGTKLFSQVFGVYWHRVAGGEGCILKQRKYLRISASVVLFSDTSSVFRWGLESQFSLAVCYRAHVNVPLPECLP